jgi:hypothetical protein
MLDHGINTETRFASLAYYDLKKAITPQYDKTIKVHVFYD